MSIAVGDYMNSAPFPHPLRTPVKGRAHKFLASILNVAYHEVQPRMPKQPVQVSAVSRYLQLILYELILLLLEDGRAELKPPEYCPSCVVHSEPS